MVEMAISPICSRYQSGHHNSARSFCGAQNFQNFTLSRDAVALQEHILWAIKVKQLSLLEHFEKNQALKD